MSTKGSPSITGCWEPYWLFSSPSFLKSLTIDRRSQCIQQGRQHEGKHIAESSGVCWVGYDKPTVSGLWTKDAGLS